MEFSTPYRLPLAAAPGGTTADTAEGSSATGAPPSVAPSPSTASRTTPVCAPRPPGGTNQPLCPPPLHEVIRMFWSSQCSQANTPPHNHHMCPPEGPTRSSLVGDSLSLGNVQDWEGGGLPPSPPLGLTREKRGGLTPLNPPPISFSRTQF